MLPSDTKLISVDDHVIEHPDVWSDRLPARFQESGPRIVEVDGGRQVWRYEDELVPISEGVVRLLPGVDRAGLPGGRVRYDEVRPGCYDPVARIGDMDIDGVWASLCFPNFTRFSGHRFLFGTDRELALLCTQAYNDFIVDEWCAAAPGRLIPMAILPLWDVDLAVAEMTRLAPKGIKAVAFSENPTVLIHGAGSGAVRPPADIYREHIYACMVTDAFAVDSLDAVGPDNLMWESDYPHQDGMFPDSRRVLEKSLAGVADHDAVKIGAGNAARVFRLDTRPPTSHP